MDTKPAAISYDDWLQIEKALSEPTFLGVPLGATLGDLFIINIVHRHGRYGWRVRLLDWFKRRWFFLRPGGQPANELIERSAQWSGRILHTWIQERPHFRELVLPVVDALGGDRSLVLGRTESMREKLPAGTEFLAMSDLPKPDGVAGWRAEYRRNRPIWRRNLAATLRQLNIDLPLQPNLELAMLRQAQRTASLTLLLDLAQPSAVVTEFDRNSLASCLVLAAKARGIPTFTMMHGTITPPFGPVPLLADVALCWGERHREQMVELGVEAERLKIVVCQRLTREIHADAAAARQKVGLPLDKPVVLLATNPIENALRRELASVFADGVAKWNKGVGAVRLHPSETLDFYHQQISRYPDLRFLDNSSWSLDEALAAADVLVCHNSGIALDALVKRKSVVILDVLPMSLGVAEELVNQAGCARAGSGDDLAEILARHSDPDQRTAKANPAAERYINHYFAAFGWQAARNIAEYLQAYAKPLKSKPGGSQA